MKSQMRTFFSGSCGEGAADEVGEGDSRNFQRVLEGEEHTEAGALVSCLFCDILTAKDSRDLSYRIHSLIVFYTEREEINSVSRFIRSCRCTYTVVSP